MLLLFGGYCYGAQQRLVMICLVCFVRTYLMFTNYCDTAPTIPNHYQSLFPPRAPPRTHRTSLTPPPMDSCIWLELRRGDSDLYFLLKSTWLGSSESDVSETHMEMRYERRPICAYDCTRHAQEFCFRLILWCLICGVGVPCAP